MFQGKDPWVGYQSAEEQDVQPVMIKKAVSTRKLSNVHSTERLYYRSQIQRLLNQQARDEKKEADTQQLIKKMKPELSKGSRRIMARKKTDYQGFAQQLPNSDHWQLNLQTATPGSSILNMTDFDSNATESILNNRVDPTLPLHLRYNQVIKKKQREVSRIQSGMVYEKMLKDPDSMNPTFTPDLSKGTKRDKSNKDFNQFLTKMQHWQVKRNNKVKKMNEDQIKNEDEAIQNAKLLNP